MPRSRRSAHRVGARRAAHPSIVANIHGVLGKDDGIIVGEGDRGAAEILGGPERSRPTSRPLICRNSHPRQVWLDAERHGPGALRRLAADSGRCGHSHQANRNGALATHLGSVCTLKRERAHRDSLPRDLASFRLYRKGIAESAVSGPPLTRLAASQGLLRLSGGGIGPESGVGRLRDALATRGSRQNPGTFSV